MYQAIEIPIKYGDLEIEKWTFILNENMKLVLDGYIKQKRDTKKHKFKTVECWTRVGLRGSDTLLDKEVLKKTEKAIWDLAVEGMRKKISASYSTDWRAK